jgi:hypothetical protein
MGNIPELPVKVEVSAKASLEVKAEIPPATAGRFVDALTDLIRPWSESRGLKADLIRLQREDVAFEIVRRAVERTRLEAAKPELIPLKILVPLLEKGSQEAADDDIMIDLWANLLASAASGKDVQPRFVGIIGELNGAQARLLRHIAFGKTRGLVSVDQQVFLRILTRDSRLVKSAEALAELIYSLLDRNGSYLVYCAVAKLLDGPGFERSSAPLKNGSPQLNTDLAILASLGLLERVNIFRDTGRPDIGYVLVDYYHTTFLAADFLKAVTFGPKAEEAEPDGDIAQK